MSLYNMVCGNNPLYQMYIGMLNKVSPLAEIPRFRDLYVDVYKDKDGKPGNRGAIVIYTRTGGGNREEYKEQNDALTKHPLYFNDFDDDFDSTFAHFCYEIPEEFRERVCELQTLLKGHPKFMTPREKFEQAMAQIKNEDTPDYQMSESDAEKASALIQELAQDSGCRPA